MVESIYSVRRFVQAECMRERDRVQKRPVKEVFCRRALRMEFAEAGSFIRSCRKQWSRFHEPG